MGHFNYDAIIRLVSFGVILILEYYDALHRFASFGSFASPKINTLELIYKFWVLLRKIKMTIFY